MKWKKNKYYLESISDEKSLCISKSLVDRKTIYTLWKLPYNRAEFIYRSENLDDVKTKAIQYNEEQPTSFDSKITGSTRLPTNEELASIHSRAKQ